MILTALGFGYLFFQIYTESANILGCGMFSTFMAGAYCIFGVGLVYVTLASEGEDANILNAALMLAYLTNRYWLLIKLKDE